MQEKAVRQTEKEARPLSRQQRILNPFTLSCENEVMNVER